MHRCDFEVSTVALQKWVWLSLAYHGPDQSEIASSSPAFLSLSSSSVLCVCVWGGGGGGQSLFSGNGLLEWNTGMEYWNGLLEWSLTTRLPIVSLSGCGMVSAECPQHNVCTNFIRKKHSC